MSDLTVLADLLGSADFPAEVIDPARATDVIIERLRDAGFNIVPTTQGIWHEHEYQRNRADHSVFRCPPEARGA